MSKFLIFLLSCLAKIKPVVVHNQFWNFFGAFVLVLIIIYNFKNYLVTLLAGFVVFCVFYFTYSPDNDNFQFTISSTLKALGNAAIIYLSSYLAGAALFTVTRKRGQKKRLNPEGSQK